MVWTCRECSRAYSIQASVSVRRSSALAESVEETLWKPCVVPLNADVTSRSDATAENPEM